MNKKSVLFLILKIFLFKKNNVEKLMKLIYIKYNTKMLN